MKPLFCRPSVLRRAAALTAAVAASVSSLSAAFVIENATGYFTPSFRGDEGSTYFGWSSGTFGSGGVLNGNPSINPGSLSGPLLAGNLPISGSGNIYSSVGAINAAGATLTIPTAGAVGAEGFTTIIIQGSGFGGFGFPLDTFTFGTIEGFAATYLYAPNGADGNPGQWWAKWEIPGNAESYTVDIAGYDAGAGVLSVTGLVVDSYYSTVGFAPDTAVIPEPSSMVLGMSAMGFLVMFRSRRK